MRILWCRLDSQSERLAHGKHGGCDRVGGIQFRGPYAMFCDITTRKTGITGTPTPVIDRHQHALVVSTRAMANPLFFSREPRDESDERN